MSKVSSKTHSKEQLDNWANQNNPNNKAYRANTNNHSNQKNPNNKAHTRTKNHNRKNKDYLLPVWASDYPEYDD